MNVFSRKEVTPEPTITGVDVLRRTVKASDAKAGVLLAIVREIDGIGISTLEAFAAGKTDLSVELLQKLTKVLYPHSELDLESGMLRSANRAPSTSYITPDRFVPGPEHYDPVAAANAPRFTLPERLQEKPNPKGPRPGWL